MSTGPLSVSPLLEGTARPHLPPRCCRCTLTRCPGGAAPSRKGRHPGEDRVGLRDAACLVFSS